MIETGDLRVSVVIPTRQRAHLWPRLLASLERQTLPPDRFEVVVSDDGSSDGTADLVSEAAATSSLHVRVLRSDPRRGQAAARNLAWRAARAPVLAFTDDDCEAQPGWLEAGLAGLRDGAVIAIGRTMPRPTDAPRMLRPFSRTVDVGELRFYETCNAFYRRDDVAAVGGFHERFTRNGGHGGEDTDLALRVLEHTGGRPVFLPAAVVHHDVHPPSWMARARETVMWTGIPLLVKRQPSARGELLHRRLFWRPSHPHVLLALVGVALASRRRGALVLAAPWLWRRTVRDPFCAGPRRRLLALPGGFALDALEVATMVRASIRHRTLVL